LTVHNFPAVTYFPEIDSTNTEARRRWAARDVSLPHWFLADRQTRGTGRRGRVWDSPAGNFSGSILFQPVTRASEWQKFAFVAALALYDALLAVVGDGEAVSLKWPNDVLLNGRKVAGILLETIGRPAPEALIAGIGVNLAQAPAAALLDQTALPPTSLAETFGTAPGLQEFFPHLRDAFDTRHAQLADTGWCVLRDAWLAQCKAIGKTASVTRTGRGGFTGTIAGLDDDGALLIRTSGGIQRVLAGDVRVREV